MHGFCPFSPLQFIFPQTPFNTFWHFGHILYPDASHKSFWQIQLCWHFKKFSVLLLFAKTFASFFFSLSFFSSSRTLTFSNIFFASIEPCACVTRTSTLFNFFGAVFLMENNSGNTSSGLTVVFCKSAITFSALLYLLFQYAADPSLIFTGDSITIFWFDLTGVLLVTVSAFLKAFWSIKSTFNSLFVIPTFLAAFNIECWFVHFPQQTDNMSIKHSLFTVSSKYKLSFTSL